MRTLVGLVLVAASASAASAGTYVGLGIGTGPSVSDSVNTPYLADGRSLRLALGYRFGNFSIEGSYTGYSTVEGNTPTSGGQFDSRTLVLAAKLNYPLGNHFEVFGRGGLLQTELDPGDNTASSTGTGFTLSAGFEYRLDLLIAGGSIFIDYTRNQASFDNTAATNNASYDQTASMWMLGVTVSL